MQITHKIDTKCEIADEKYVRVKKDNATSYYEKDKKIRGQVVYEKCNKINSENWNKAMTEFKPNGALKTHSITHFEMM